VKSDVAARLAAVWNSLLVIVMTVGALVIPLLGVFHESFDSFFLPFDRLFTIVLGVDLIIKLRELRTRQDDNGASNFRDTKSYFLLFLDLIAVLPLFSMTGIVWLEILRLAKFARIIQLMQQWRRDSVHNWNILRLSFFIYWLFLSIHWLTAGWLVLRGHTAGEPVWGEYLHSLYWCIQTLSSVGYGDVIPTTNAEYLYAITVMLFGVGVFGYIVGNVASLLANIDPAKAHYLETMEKLTAFMKYRNLPAHLQRRIRDYFQYLWEHRRGYDEAAALSALPPQLMHEVSVHLKNDIIENAPFFRNASEQLVREIGKQMRPVTYMPGDFVFKAGESGQDMYFVSQGKLEVISQDGKTVLNKLSDGDFFGEISLVQSRPRTASVRALAYCDLYALEKTALDHVLQLDEEFAAKVEKSIRERLDRGV